MTHCCHLLFSSGSVLCCVTPTTLTKTNKKLQVKSSHFPKLSHGPDCNLWLAICLTPLRITTWPEPIYFCLYISLYSSFLSTVYSRRALTKGWPTETASPPSGTRGIPGRRQTQAQWFVRFSCIWSEDRAIPQKRHRRGIHRTPPRRKKLQKKKSTLLLYTISEQTLKMLCVWITYVLFAIQKEIYVISYQFLWWFLRH